MSGEGKSGKGNWTKVFRTLMLLVIVAGLIVAACFYAYFVQYYSEHFYEGTTINGIDCSDLTEDQAAELLQEEIDKWEVTVKERDGVTDKICASDIGMSYENDGSLKDLLVLQQPLLWAVRLYSDKTYEVPSGFTYDEQALKQCFENFQQVKEFVPMKNAELVKNEDGTSRIEPEVVGTEMDQDAAYEALLDAVKNQKSEIDLEEFYKTPTVFSDDEDLKEEMECENVKFSLTRAQISIQFGEEQITLDENTLKDWLVKDKTEKYKIDETKLREFVQGLYDKYNVGHEGQLFKTKNGRVLTLKYFETTGWNIDVDKSCERYLNAIEEGYQGVLGPVMTRLDEDGKEAGGTYVEISIDEQNMWYFVNGEILVDTPIVSGGADVGSADAVSLDTLIAEFNSRSTPTNGIWTIKKKESPHFMKGPEIAEGVYEYTLDVTYWLPFNDQIGIHDNYQRVEYGGKIYQTSGSHGCINTPYEEVEKIFKNIDVGCMVIVYGKDQGEELFIPSNKTETSENDAEQTENSDGTEEDDTIDEETEEE